MSGGRNVCRDREGMRVNVFVIFAERIRVE